MTEPNRQSGENEERIIEIEIERLRPFKEHPFQVKDDKEMFLLQVLWPIICFHWYGVALMISTFRSP